MTTEKVSKVKNVEADKPKKRSLFNGGAMTFLSKLAKSLMVPIAILPFAALINRLGALMETGFVAGQVAQYDPVWWIGRILQIPGAVIFDNLALFFALGLGFGLADDHRGEAGLAAVVAFLGLVAMTGPDGLAQLFYGKVDTYDQNAVNQLTQSIREAIGSKTTIFSPPILNLNDGVLIDGYFDKDGNALDPFFANSVFSFFDGKSQLLFFVNGWDLTPLYSTAAGSLGSIQGYYLIPDVGYMLDVGVFGGIVAGGTTAFLYNKYREVNIPQSLSFFGGRRFVPMLAIASVWVLGLFFAALWPWIQLALIKFGGVIASKDAARTVGFGGYALLNKLGQPLGLHHIINTFLWFQLPVSGVSLADAQTYINSGSDPGSLPTSQVIFGDITAFQDGIMGSGTFQSGFFPLYMGGLPGAALAMTLAAPKENRKEIGVFLASVGSVAFLTGIDEPIVFTFVFLSPILYVLNAVFTAFFGMIVTASHISLGFGFSAGLIDYLISVTQGWQMSGLSFNGTEWVHASVIYQIFANPLMIFVWAAAMFGTYFVSFYFIITKMDIETPGREKEGSTKLSIGRETGPKKTKTKGKEKYETMAQAVLDIIGKENIKEITNCTTRLRLVITDNKAKNIDDKKLKEAGFNTVIRVGSTTLQLVVGTDVEYVTNALERKMK